MSLAKKIKKHRKKFAYLAVIALLLGGFFLAAGLNQLHFDQEKPQFGEENVAAQNYYKSLDLSLAQQAAYTNQSISQTQDLGVKDKVKHYVISFKVPKDHLSEYGLMTLPDKPAPQTGYPVIVLCHGYTNPRFYSTTKAYLPDMEFYSQNGFAVVKPDYRGQGLSSHAGIADGAFYSMSYNTDVLSLIAAIKETSYLNKNNISLWGHSMGAYVALRAAVLEPDIRNVILLSGPVGTVRDMFSQYVASSTLDNPIAKTNKDFELEKHGTPYSNPQYWERTSPLNYLYRSHATFQIHVGDEDRIVPPHFSADLNARLASLKKPHQYYIYQNAGHGLVPQRQLIWKRSLKLLQS